MKPEDLLYAKTHEWIHVAADASGTKVVTLGISDFAVEALTDLVFIELPEIDREVTAGEPFCEIESVKAVSDLYAPVTGKVIAVNDSLPDNLEILGNDPYGEGWIAKIQITDEAGLADLLDHATYQKQCQEETM